MINKVITEKLSLELVVDVPDFIKEQLEKGDMLVKARSIHEQFLEEPWQSELAKDSKNNRLLWRHRDPENPTDRGDVFGRNLHEEVNDGFSESYLRIFGGEPGSAEDNLQKLIKKQLEAKNPIGLSKGFIKKSKNGKIYRVIALEDSITYKPACKQCTTQEVLIQMEDKDKVAQEIKKLQESLDSHKLQLEEKDKAIDEMNIMKAEYETKMKKLESNLSAKDKEVEETKNKKETLEEKLIKLSDSFISFKEETEKNKKAPLINEIFEYEQDEDLKEVYSDWSIEKLEARKEKVKGKYSAPTVETKTFEQEKLEAQKKSLEAKDLGMSALRNLTKDELKIALEIEKEDKLLYGE